ncbi:unnamed protein product [Brassica rapa subsp. trilocularis]
MRVLILQGRGCSTIKRLAAPPPPFKSACFVSERPGRYAVVEISWEWICSHLIVRFLTER